MEKSRTLSADADITTNLLSKDHDADGLADKEFMKGLAGFLDTTTRRSSSKRPSASQLELGYQMQKEDFAFALKKTWEERLRLPRSLVRPERR